MKVENQSKQYTEIKVFNWNTNLWDQSKDKDRYYKFLKEQKADMYILQEYLHLSINPAEYSLGNIDQSRSFRACSVIPGFPPIYRAIDDTERIAKEFPGYYIHTNLQFVLISRFPIIESHADYSEQYAVFDVDIHGRLVRFFNIHMLLHIEPGNPFAPYFYQALNRRFQARRLGFRDLKENIRKTESAYLIAGDFNSTNAMGVMNDLLKNHIDAIKYSNDLIPLSFEYKGLRLWRFDYALVSKTNNNLKIKFSKIINNEGLSDHNPLYLILDIKPINK